MMKVYFPQFPEPKTIKFLDKYVFTKKCNIFKAFIRSITHVMRVPKVGY